MSIKKERRDERKECENKEVKERDDNKNEAKERRHTKNERK